METVIAHQQAASDTEAMREPPARLARSSMPGRPASHTAPQGLPDALRLPGSDPKPKPRRAASTDDDEGGSKEETNLGWLDLQAFAPRALQKQLEKLMESSRGDGDARAQGGIAGAASAAREALAGLRMGGEQSSEPSDAGVLATPRTQSGGSSSSGLRAALQRRGGVGEGHEAGAVAVENASPDFFVRDEAPPMMQLHPVPEDEVVASLPELDLVPSYSAVVPPTDGLHASDGGPAAAEILEDAAIGHSDVSASAVPTSPTEDAVIERSDVSSSPVPTSPTEDVTGEVLHDAPSEDTTCESSAAAPEDNSAAEPEVSEMRAEAVPTEPQENEFEAVTEAPVPEPAAIATPLDEVPQRTASAPDTLTTVATPAAPRSPKQIVPAVPEFLQLRPPQDEGTPKIVEAALPQARRTEPVKEAPKDSAPGATDYLAKAELRRPAPAQQAPKDTAPGATDYLAARGLRRPSPVRDEDEAKAPVLAPAPQWNPGYVAVASKPKVVAADPAAEEKVEEAKAKANKFKDMREFWGKHKSAFAGPSLGAKGISKAEAQAAMQRLTQNAANCDPNEVRRLKKLIEMP